MCVHMHSHMHALMHACTHARARTCAHDVVGKGWRERETDTNRSSNTACVLLGVIDDYSSVFLSIKTHDVIQMLVYGIQ